MSDRNAQDILGRIAASTFNIPAGEFDDSVNLLELGIDSLMLLKFGQEIERQLHVKLEMSWFFKNQPNLKTLAAHVAELSAELPVVILSGNPSKSDETEKEKPLELASEPTDIPCQNPDPHHFRLLLHQPTLCTGLGQQR